jgi:hypothetical protein
MIKRGVTASSNFSGSIDSPVGSNNQKQQQQQQQRRTLLIPPVARRKLIQRAMQEQRERKFNALLGSILILMTMGFIGFHLSYQSIRTIQKQNKSHTVEQDVEDNNDLKVMKDGDVSHHQQLRGSGERNVWIHKNSQPFVSRSNGFFLVFFCQVIFGGLQSFLSFCFNLTYDFVVVNIIF